MNQSKWEHLHGEGPLLMSWCRWRTTVHNSRIARYLSLLTLRWLPKLCHDAIRNISIHSRIVNLSPTTGPRLVSTNLAEDNEAIVSTIKMSTTSNFNIVWKFSCQNNQTFLKIYFWNQLMILNEITHCSLQKVQSWFEIAKVMSGQTIKVSKVSYLLHAVCVLLIMSRFNSLIWAAVHDCTII